MDLGSYNTPTPSANIIGANDKWVVDLIWSDLAGLYSADPASATAITLVGGGRGMGPVGTFTLNVPAGKPAGNFLLGLKKGQRRQNRTLFH